MKMEHWIRAIDGTFILGSVALGYLQSQYWFLLSVFVGINLLQSAFTGYIYQASKRVSSFSTGYV